MRNVTLIVFIIFEFISCKLIDDQVGCSEFYVKTT